MERSLVSTRVRWGVRIPLRDGVHLSATLYLPDGDRTQMPAIFTLTPYIAQTYHDRGMYFAGHGYPFLTVDVRGRGNSEGVFRPFIQEARDGFDVVEWLAQQPYCNGQVAMWGGSYAGYNQWAVAREFPPHLTTIVPAAAAFPSVDYPLRNNIAKPYWMQWLTFVSGRGSQDKIFSDRAFWSSQFRDWFESGASFKELDTFLGNASPSFQEWVAHPEQGVYWDDFNPSAAQYAQLSIPILTITGLYDADQAGALMNYREHMKHDAGERRSPHCLVIGPWDHAGTRDPKLEFCGLKVGPASLVDLGKLHLDWYAWVMKGASRPAFLRKNVAYYVMGREEWRYADTLEEITVSTESLYLQSNCNPIDVFRSGSLTRELPAASEPDQYVHDPSDVTLAALESVVDPADVTDQRMVHARVGKELVYHSAPFERDVEVSGFFKLSVWLAIDQLDTDFRASVYEIALDGSSILLATDSIRARYRETLRQARLIRTTEPLRYDFERFMFVSRRIGKGCRLRLVIGPMDSIYSQKNYNGGGVVSEESVRDARRVTVRLFHDNSHPSALHVPFGESAT